MGTKKFDFFSKKFEIEFDLYFDLCWRAELIQVGLNMHLYVDIGDASSSLWGSTSSFFFVDWSPHVEIYYKGIMMLLPLNYWWKGLSAWWSCFFNDHWFDKQQALCIALNSLAKSERGLDWKAQFCRTWKLFRNMILC